MRYRPELENTAIESAAHCLCHMIIIEFSIITGVQHEHGGSTWLQNIRIINRNIDDMREVLYRSDAGGPNTS